MNRFMIFMFKSYYPNGGMEDYKGSCSTIEEVELLIRDSFTEDGAVCNINIYDSQTNKIMMDGDYSFDISDGQDEDFNYILDEDALKEVLSKIQECLDS